MAISKHDKQALADLFIHMGVPLVTAMQTVDSWSGGASETLEERTKKLSKLLTVSVEFSTKITKKLEIRDAYTLENVRGKIIRIITPMVAENYITGGEVPTSDQLDDLASLFDVLISFAQSVSPTDEKGSKPAKIAIMIDACDPILSAVRDNNLGMDDQDAFNKSVAGIMARATQMAPTLGLDNAIESGLFKSIVSIYVSCYKQAVENGENDINSIWKECDERLVIIQALTGFVATQANIKIEDKKPKPKPAPAKVEQKQKEPTKDSKDDSDDDDDGEFNPMSFFSSNG